MLRNPPGIFFHVIIIFVYSNPSVSNLPEPVSLEHQTQPCKLHCSGYGAHKFSFFRWDTLVKAWTFSLQYPVSLSCWLILMHLMVYIVYSHGHYLLLTSCRFAFLFHFIYLFMYIPPITYCMSVVLLYFSLSQVPLTDEHNQVCIIHADWWWSSWVY